jgi:hypothetical protein
MAVDHQPSGQCHHNGGHMAFHARFLRCVCSAISGMFNEFMAISKIIGCFVTAWS